MSLGDTPQYVLGALPPPPARVLEVGAGDGELAAVLAGRGYDVVAIDPHAPDGAPVRPVALLDLDEAPQSFDAAVAVLSLHHVEPLEESCRHLADLLRPGAPLVLDEFDVARFDEREARWWLARRADEHRGPAEVVANLRHHCHTFAQVSAALAPRFALGTASTGPYLYRWGLPEGVLDDEEAAIAAGEIGPTGVRMVARATPFSAELWSRGERTFAAILEHPFVAGLTDGSLDRAAFRSYVIQDAHYLREYARALSICAAKAPAEPDIAMFARHAAEAIEVERSLHDAFFADLGVGEDERRATPMSPTNLAYTSYLLAAAYSGSFAEALGAVLPCYWIYWEVGKALEAKGSPDPLYRRWIETYGGEEFGTVVRDVIGLADRLGPRLSADEREAMAERYAVTARYEWMFWDAAWRGERWPAFP